MLEFGEITLDPAVGECGGYGLLITIAVMVRVEKAGTVVVQLFFFLFFFMIIKGIKGRQIEVAARGLIEAAARNGCFHGGLCIVIEYIFLLSKGESLLRHHHQSERGRGLPLAEESREPGAHRSTRVNPKHHSTHTPLNLLDSKKHGSEQNKSH